MMLRTTRIWGSIAHPRGGCRGQPSRQAGKVHRDDLLRRASICSHVSGLRLRPAPPGSRHPATRRSPSPPPPTLIREPSRRARARPAPGRRPPKVPAGSLRWHARYCGELPYVGFEEARCPRLPRRPGGRTTKAGGSGASGARSSAWARAGERGADHVGWLGAGSGVSPPLGVGCRLRRERPGT